MIYPHTRMRRLRGHPVIRDLVREHEIFLNDLVVPLFVVEGLSQPQEISSMPGQFRYPIPELVEHCKQLYALGLKAIILFGVPMNKDPEGSQAYAEDGIIQAAVRAIRASVPQLLIMTDVCLCEYTSHGHCGLIKNGQVANDETLELLAKTALSHVLAGAQVIAPSDMMDGRILAIRKILDQHAHTDIPIISYAAKYASAYYGPFREAAQSTPQFGDRRSYQMDPANLREALREVAIDIEESADIVMVKPALAYLDVIRAVRQTFQVPVAAYNVSGEYAMIKAAAQNSWIDERRIVIETLTSMKRAGADLIFSYHAPDVARWLNES